MLDGAPLGGAAEPRFAGSPSSRSLLSRGYLSPPETFRPSRRCVSATRDNVRRKRTRRNVIIKFGSTKRRNALLASLAGAVVLGAFAEAIPAEAAVNSDGLYLCQDDYFENLYEGWFLQKHLVVGDASYIVDLADSGLTDAEICQDILATIPNAEQVDCETWVEVIDSVPAVVNDYANAGSGAHFMFYGGFTYNGERYPAGIFSTMSCTGPHFM